MAELDFDPQDLCALPCLQNLTYLALDLFSDLFGKTETKPSFPCLRTLHVAMESCGTEVELLCDLSECPSLHALSLSFRNLDPRPPNVCPTMNLKGLKGVHASALQIRLDNFRQPARILADFSDWQLEAVDIQRYGVHNWHRDQWVLDLLGALVGEVCMSKISISF